MDKIVYRWTTPDLSSDGSKILNEIISSGQWSYGPISRIVEQRLSSHLKNHSVLLTNSGTSALWIILSQLRNQEKEQAIILPAFGYSAAASVAASLGFRIYVADTCKEAPVINPDSIKYLLDDMVVAVIGINYFGYSVDWENVKQVSGNIPTIEDAAGSFGASYANRPCGTNADLAIMSFHTSKAIAAGGEGGCIISKDESFIRASRNIAKNGHSSGFYYAESIGMNMLMTDLASCFLDDSINSYTNKFNFREKIVKNLDSIFTQMGYLTGDFNLNSINRKQNWQLYTLLSKNREEFINIMRINGFEIRPCWPHLINNQPVLAKYIKKIDGNLPNSNFFADRIVNFPINLSDFDESIMERLVAILKKINLEEEK